MSSIGKRRKKTDSKSVIFKVKVALVALEAIIIASILMFGIYIIQPGNAMKFVKSDMAKWLIQSPIGKYFIGYIVDEDDFNNNIHDSDFDSDKVETNPGINTEALKGYTNIALFGLDAREGEFDNRTHSDSMMIASINNETGEVRLVSLYRDNMVRIQKQNGDVIYTKLNYAYFEGGVTTAINTINQNFDLNIKDYAIVNFTGLAKIIDALGGVSVNLTDEEVYYLNGYIKETSSVTGIESDYIKKGGKNIKLNGVQAVSYCRIRYTRYYVYDDNNNPVYSDSENKIQLSYGSDFGRTARQRNVMNKLVAKAKSAGVTKLMEIADIVFKSTDNNKLLRTSLTYDEILSMIPTLIEFSLVSEEGKQGFPYSYVTPTINGASMVVVRGHSRNVTLLHEYLFGEKDYIPSDIVQRINNVITSVSGY